jgi:mycothiol system anti-sigma-R factor
MTCEESIKLVDGYLDRELDPISNQRIEKHLSECPRCQEVYQAQESLITALKSAAPYHRAPAELRRRIQSSLVEASNGASKGAARARPQQRPRTLMFLSQWNWLGLAAAIILVAITLFNFLPRPAKPGQFLVTQLVAGHVRSLMANHLTDVASSDQHTVKPWLDTKLDFAPTVLDLAADGFPLIGGRLDYLENRQVAALVYQRRKHFINLFVWPLPSERSSAPQTLARDGYHLVHWTDADLNYWAVSDVSENDLQEFKALFQKQQASR